MKKSIIVLLLFILIGCSKNAYVEENLDATPEYLEETQLTTQTNQETIEKMQRLQSLQNPEYKIGPGDKFKIYVYDEPEMDTDAVLVKPDGTITFRLIGETKVEGLTVAEASTLLEEKLKEYIRFPKVSLIPFEIKSATVTLLGKITYPGVYTIEGHMRLLDVIAKAGGLALGYFQANSVELADLERSFMIRNGEVLPIDFVDLIQKGNMLYNIPLMDKDYIYLPSAINKEIYVIGEVNSPGHFAFKESMTVGQIIAFAQSFKETAQSTVYVVRGNLSHPRMFKVDLKAILKGKTRDFPLKPNDIVYVPKSPIAEWNKVLSQMLPSLQAVQATWMVQDMLKNGK